MIISSTQYPHLVVLRGHLSEKKNHAKTVRKDVELQAVIISKWEKPYRLYRKEPAEGISVYAVVLRPFFCALYGSQNPT